MSRPLSIPERFEKYAFPEPNSGCFIWMGAVNACGYGTLGIRDRSYLAHRVIYQHYVSHIPEGKCVLHRCDLPCCVNPDHLFIGEPANNVADMEQKGRARHPSGENHGRAVLTEEAVRFIRNSSESSRALGVKYGVSKTMILYVRHRKTWKNVV